MEANLRSLQVERLDLVNLRLVGAARDAAVPLEGQLSAPVGMREEDKLDLIGLSNIDRAQVQRALEPTPPPSIASAPAERITGIR